MVPIPNAIMKTVVCTEFAARASSALAPYFSVSTGARVTVAFATSFTLPFRTAYTSDSATISVCPGFRTVARHRIRSSNTDLTHVTGFDLRAANEPLGPF